MTTSGDGVALVWDLSSYKQLRVLEGHSAEVSASLMTHKARQVSLLNRIITTPFPSPLNFNLSSSHLYVSSIFL